MKIAFTGASSTGKSTLASRLMEVPRLRAIIPHRINVDARQLLSDLGYARGVDSMSGEDRRIFQARYLAEKVSLEDGRDGYVSERSFVDVAAFWVAASADQLAEPDDFLRRCASEASRYDLHVHLPVGVIPHQSDGLRSDDQAYHRRVDSLIRSFLIEWRLPHISVSTVSVDDRVREVVAALGEIGE